MADLKQSLMEDVGALKCLKPLKELELESLLGWKTLSALSLGRPGGLCSPLAPLPGDEGMGPAVQPGRSMARGCSKGCLSLLSTAISRGKRVPSCSSQMQEMGVIFGSHCSKRCPRSIHHHLALPGGWAVTRVARKELSFPKLTNI